MRALAFVCFALSTFASAQTLETRTYPTSGHPTVAMATPDGKYVLVTVNRDGGSGIEVFRDTGSRLERTGFQKLGSEGAQDLVLIPNTHIIAVGVSNAGVAFLPLDETIAGKAKPQVLPQGEKSGSGYLAVTPDGEYLFVANEYGDRGNIGVIALHPDASGGIHPEMVTHIPTPNTTPGVTISPDGKRLYTVGEVATPEAVAKLPGHGIKELQRDGCVQADPSRARPNGVLFTIDVQKVRALTPASTQQDAAKTRISIFDAGCSPVREAVSDDNATVYVTARGDNRVLVFDARALEADRDHAFLRAIPSGGDAPVGLKLFAAGKLLLVANSNRFANGPGNATLFDLADPATPKVLQTIRTGAFPRNLTESADGKTLYLTVFNADELMVLRLK